LFAGVLVLWGFGLLALYSVALAGAENNYTYLIRHLIFGGVGIAVCIAMSFLDYRIWRLYSIWIYAGIVALLGAVLIFGATIRGTTGWFVVADQQFQPVEFAKVGFLLFLAAFESLYARFINMLRYMALNVLAVSIILCLILLQPDFGSAMLFGGVWMMLLLVTGIRKKYILLFAVCLLAAFAAGWFFLFADYQKDRVLTFLDPARDPLGSGYNITQSVIAVGSGKLFGRGVSFGSQSQLKFLPEAQTDFIFSVLAEDLGFIGMLVFFAFWLLVFWRIVTALRYARDDFGLFMVLGTLAILLMQLAVNVGMNMGLLPVTGITLPFVSYGGSSLVSSFIIIGLIESMYMRSKRWSVAELAG